MQFAMRPGKLCSAAMHVLCETGLLMVAMLRVTEQRLPCLLLLPLLECCGHLHAAFPTFPCSAAQHEQWEIPPARVS